MYEDSILFHIWKQTSWRWSQNIIYATLKSPGDFHTEMCKLALMRSLMVLSLQYYGKTCQHALSFKFIKCYTSRCDLQLLVMLQHWKTLDIHVPQAKNMYIGRVWVLFTLITPGLSKDIQCHVWPYTFLCLQKSPCQTSGHTSHGLSAFVIADDQLIFLRGLCYIGRKSGMISFPIRDLQSLSSLLLCSHLWLATWLRSCRTW